jgi:ABC-type dipeptide/oligopeptide/nickel transport system ATPase component
MSAPHSDPHQSIDHSVEPVHHHHGHARGSRHIGGHHLLQVEDLSISFTMYDPAEPRFFKARRKPVPVIHDLHVGVHAGELVAIVGASGSGKTLLADAIMGMFAPNATVRGRIWFDGVEQDAASLAALRGNGISLMPQSVTYLDPLMKVGPQIRGARGPQRTRGAQRGQWQGQGQGQNGDVRPCENPSRCGPRSGIAVSTQAPPARMDSTAEPVPRAVAVGASRPSRRMTGFSAQPDDSFPSCEKDGSEGGRKNAETKTEKNRPHSVIHSGKTKKNRPHSVSRLLARYDLPPEVVDKYPHELSGGMARRVLLCCALMDEPRVIIADEPTPGLDLDLAQRALADLREFADGGGGVLLITHDIELALRVADRVAVFDSGTVVEEVAVADFASPDTLTHPFSRALWHALPEHDFAVAPEDEALEGAASPHAAGSAGSARDPRDPDDPGAPHADHNPKTG